MGPHKLWAALLLALLVRVLIPALLYGRLVASDAPRPPPLGHVWTQVVALAPQRAAASKQAEQCATDGSCEDKDYSPESGEWYGEWFRGIPKIK
jgi:hypothetical protein